MKASSRLCLGAEVIHLLIPHRRPFLMVDVIESYERGPRPTLRAARVISANEPVFEGHFPDLCLWPGVYTIEGMGQSNNLLSVISAYEDAWEAAGHDPAEVLEGLKNLALGYRLHPGYKPELATKLLSSLKATANRHIGMSAAVDVKLLHPVFAGQRLEYISVRSHIVDNLIRFEVEARVDGRTVAKGVMTGTRGIPPLPEPG
jgi:3-hydroxyacyl-[acyl-carrier-protein] dehydratase